MSDANQTVWTAGGAGFMARVFAWPDVDFRAAERRL
jgi:hypothetical protein